MSNATPNAKTKMMAKNLQDPQGAQPTTRDGDTPQQNHQHLRSMDEVLEDATNSRRNENEARGCLSSLFRRNGSRIDWKQWRYWRIFVCLGVCNSSDATEILSLSYILAEKGFASHILMHSAWRASCLASAVFVGMLVGGLWVGSIGDTTGRRPALLAGLATNAVAGSVAALAPNVLVLSLLRFIAGVGIGYSIPPLFTLCSELAPAKDRGFWVAVAASFWMVGSVYVAVVAWVLLSGLQATWRIFALTCAIPSAVGYVMVRLWVPESPRYLALQGNHHDAVHVVEQLTARAILYQGRSWSFEEALQQYSSSHVAISAAVDASQPWWGKVRQTFTNMFNSLSLLYTKQLKGTTWPLQAVWFTLSFGSYGLSTWINTLFVQVELENMYQNALLFALSSLPGNLFSAILIDSKGRSTLLVGSLVSAALSLLAFAYIASVDAQDSRSLPKGLIVLSACAFQCFSVVAWNTIAVLTPEVYPTAVRNTGMGLCGATGRVGAMVAQMVNGYTVEKPALLLSISATTLLFGAMSPMLLPPDKSRQAVVDVIPSVGVAEETTSILDRNHQAMA